MHLNFIVLEHVDRQIFFLWKTWKILTEFSPPKKVWCVHVEDKTANSLHATFWNFTSILHETLLDFIVDRFGRLLRWYHRWTHEMECLSRKMIFLISFMCYIFFFHTCANCRSRIWDVNEREMMTRSNDNDDGRGSRRNIEHVSRWGWRVLLLLMSWWESCHHVEDSTRLEKLWKLLIMLVESFIKGSLKIIWLFVVWKIDSTTLQYLSTSSLSPHWGFEGWNLTFFFFFVCSAKLK